MTCSVTHYKGEMEGQLIPAAPGAHASGETYFLTLLAPEL
jgi:hypothetical protein